MRVGLAGEQTPQDALDRLLPTIRGDITFESDRIRDEGFEDHMVLRQSAETGQNAGLLARFLDLPVEKTQEIVEQDYLFAD